MVKIGCLKRRLSPFGTHIPNVSNRSFKFWNITASLLQIFIIDIYPIFIYTHSRTSTCRCTMFHTLQRELWFNRTFERLLYFQMKCWNFKIKDLCRKHNAIWHNLCHINFLVKLQLLFIQFLLNNKLRLSEFENETYGLQIWCRCTEVFQYFYSLIINTWIYIICYSGANFVSRNTSFQSYSGIRWAIYGVISWISRISPLPIRNSQFSRNVLAEGCVVVNCR